MRGDVRTALRERWSGSPVGRTGGSGRDPPDAGGRCGVPWAGMGARCGHRRLQVRSRGRADLRQRPDDEGGTAILRGFFRDRRHDPRALRRRVRRRDRQVCTPVAAGGARPDDLFFEVVPGPCQDRPGTRRGRRGDRWRSTGQAAGQGAGQVDGQVVGGTLRGPTEQLWGIRLRWPLAEWLAAGASAAAISLDGADENGVDRSGRVRFVGLDVVASATRGSLSMELSLQSPGILAAGGRMELGLGRTVRVARGRAVVRPGILEPARFGNERGWRCAF